MTEIQLRQKILDTAFAWLGKNEADGSFREIIDLYNSHKPLPRGYAVKYTDEWCATFVSAVFIKAGLESIAPAECSCQKMIDLHKALGTWEERDDYIPTPGDIIMYDWADDGKGDNSGWADHVGIVYEVSDSAITVIEGNRKNAVGWRTVAADGKQIRGYCLPDYGSMATYAAPADYAAESCGKAVGLGIVKGNGKGNYRWEEPISRQDLCVVLDRLGLLG